MKSDADRTNYGFIDITHKGRVIQTSVGSVQYEKTFCGLRSNENFPNKIASIPAGYAHRPDLISNLWLETPGLWWFLCERNNIFDIFEQMNVSDRIYLPV